MFLRIVGDSFSRKPRQKVLMAGALALGMAVATATLSVALDVGDRLAREFRSFGANLLVTPQADTLPLEVGGVDYRPVSEGAYLPEADLGKLKTIFWRNNIIGFAPILETPAEVWTPPVGEDDAPYVASKATLIGTWSHARVASPDGGSFLTGIEKTNPWWSVEGRWFGTAANECVVGVNFARRARVRIGDAVVTPLAFVQQLAGKPGVYRRLYVSALTKPEDDFGRRDPAKMSPEDYDRWYCSPYISSIALQIQQALPGAEARVIRRVAEGEGRILTRVSALMWLVTFAALVAAALAVGATSATTVLERRTEIGLMKAIGAGKGMVGAFFLAEQFFLAVIGGGTGYAAGIVLARLVGERVFGAAPEQRLILLPVILALAVAVALVGSLVPLRRAARLDPAPVLRGE